MFHIKKKSNLWIYAFGVGDVGAGRHNDTIYTGTLGQEVWAKYYSSHLKYTIKLNFT